MYNPAGMASNLRQTGIWGSMVPAGVQPQLVNFDAPPLDITLPVIRIAPNDSVPKAQDGPSPGAAWWSNFQDSVQNGAAWVWDRATMIFPEGDAEKARELEAVGPKSQSLVVLAAVAGAAFLILRK